MLPFEFDRSIASISIWETLSRRKQSADDGTIPRLTFDLLASPVDSSPRSVPRISIAFRWNQTIEKLFETLLDRWHSFSFTSASKYSSGRRSFIELELLLRRRKEYSIVNGSSGFVISSRSLKLVFCFSTRSVAWKTYLASTLNARAACWHNPTLSRRLIEPLMKWIFENKLDWSLFVNLR